MTLTPGSDFFSPKSSPSRAARKAASVLPEPVGASMRELSPLRKNGQLSDCTRVGLAKASVNHARVQGWNNANAFDSAATRVAADSACAVLVFAMSPSTAPVRGWTYGFALLGGSRYSTLSADYRL